MGRLTRRDFLIYGSAATLCSANLASPLELNAATLPAGLEQEDPWIAIGRLERQQRADSMMLKDGFLISKRSWGDTDFSFQARAPEGVEVQIWAGLRCRDRDSRYVFGLRGGNNDHVYLARYAPDGGDRFLGIAPLGFHPEPGTWYALRAAMRGSRIHIYVNDESLPRINVEDAEALRSEGGVRLAAAGCQWSSAWWTLGHLRGSMQQRSTKWAAVCTKRRKRIRRKNAGSNELPTNLL